MDELARMGIKISPQGHVPPLAATYAIKVALQAVYDGAAPRDVPNIADKEMMAKYIRRADYDQWDEGFSRRGVINEPHLRNAKKRGPDSMSQARAVCQNSFIVRSACRRGFAYRAHDALDRTAVCGGSVVAPSSPT